MGHQVHPALESAICIVLSDTHSKGMALLTCVSERTIQISHFCARNIDVGRLLLDVFS